MRGPPCGPQFGVRPPLDDEPGALSQRAAEVDGVASGRRGNASASPIVVAFGLGAGLANNSRLANFLARARRSHQGGRLLDSKPAGMPGDSGEESDAGPGAAVRVGSVAEYGGKADREDTIPIVTSEDDAIAGSGPVPDIGPFNEGLRGLEPTLLELIRRATRGVPPGPEQAEPLETTAAESFGRVVEESRRGDESSLAG